MRRLLAALTLLAPLLTAADEGMWTFDAFPSEKVQRAYGFSPTPAWLENVRLSSARLAGGCSGSFVSEQGLVMTNHHCAHSCIEQLSRAGKDFVKDGFYARTAADEPKCPDIEVNQLVEIADVTARVRAATKGLEREAYEKALRGEMAKIEKECQTSDALRCDVVTLYHGGLYHLYTYRRFQDVRLVFAPEFAIAFFGGDPDNFNFPRYDLDVAFLRVYEDGKPARMKNWFRWSRARRRARRAHVRHRPPGRHRPHRSPCRSSSTSATWRSRTGCSTSPSSAASSRSSRCCGPEQKRYSTARLFYVENSYKALQGPGRGAPGPRLLPVEGRGGERAPCGDREGPGAREDGAARVRRDRARAGAAAARSATELNARGARASTATCSGSRARWSAGPRSAPSRTTERLREFRESNLPAVTQQTLLRGADLPRVREAPPRPLAHEDPREPRRGSPVREEGPREGVAGGGRCPRRGRNQARRRRAPQAALGRRHARRSRPRRAIR